MKVAVTGSSGFVGSSLVPYFLKLGHRVTRVVRSHPGPGEVRWNPVSERVEQEKLEGYDAVIHLAGESVASGRWTPDKKNRIRESRLRGTRFLSGVLAGLERPPKVFLSASAIGVYGDRGDEVLNEDSPAGKGFLAEVGGQWESATEPARAKGIRTVNMRIGLVLGITGGALEKMLPPFRMGLGGPLGSGRQYMSWISLDDLVGAMQHAMLRDTLEGPVNLVAPNPVTNAEFTRVLARVLRRPAFLPAPGFALRAILGEMAQELLLASTRVEPARLKESGYRFRHPTLEKALRDILGKSLKEGGKQ